MAQLLSALQPPPFRVPLLDDQGQLVETWARFFLTAQAAIVQILAAKPSALVGSIMLPLDDVGERDEFSSVSAPVTGRLSGLFTVGSVIFAGVGGVLSQDNPKFFWDDTNFRLGINTNVPTVPIDASGPDGAILRSIAPTDVWFLGQYSGARAAGNGVRFRAYDSVPQFIGELQFKNANGTTNQGQFVFSVGDGAGGTLSMLHGDLTGLVLDQTTVIGTDPGGGGKLRVGGAIGASGLINRYNNIATAGGGVPAIYGQGRVLAQGGAVASVATYTVGATDGSFLVSMNILITAFTAGTISGVVTYTDESSTARSLTMNFSAVTGVLATTAGAAGAFEGVPLHIRAKASTAITATTTISVFTGTYNVEAFITQLG